MGNIWNCIKLDTKIKNGEKVCTLKNKEGTLTYYEDIPEENFEIFLKDIEKKAKKKRKTVDEYLNEEVLGFGKIQNAIFKGKIVAIFTKGKSLELLGADFINIFGNKIINLSQEGTVAITGVLDDVLKIKYLRSQVPDLWKQGINIGGTDVLSSPVWFKITEKYKHLKNTNSKLYWKNITEDFWREVNQPWLDDVIKRGDDVRFVSDPKAEKSLYVFLKDEKQFAIGLDGKKVRTIFGQEIEYLLKNGYEIIDDVAKKTKK